MTLCEHCEQEQEIELLEVWDHRQFMVSTRCEMLQAEVHWGLKHDPEWARDLLRRLGVEAICGHSLRRVADDAAGGLVLDWNLRLGCIAFRDAQAFVAAHHQHARPPVAWRYGSGLWNGPDLIGGSSRTPVRMRMVGAFGLQDGDATCLREVAAGTGAAGRGSIIYSLARAGGGLGS